MVCTECRRAKVKCVKEDGDEKCVRCESKKVECIPFKSRQGQRPKRPRLETSDGEASSSVTFASNGGGSVINGSLVAKSSSPPRPLLQDEPSTNFIKKSSILPKKRPCPLGSAIDAATLTTEVTSEVPLAVRSTHYGCLYLVRSWLSMAFVRRSMSLLARAGSMASKCGFTMDQIMADFPHQRGMDFLYPILLQPASEQKVIGPPLRYDELPKRLLKAVHCPVTNSSGTGSPNGNSLTDPVSHRWIYCREMIKGISRFFVSTAFSWDLASHDKIKEVYVKNQESVVEIFMPDESANLRAIAHQISLLSRPNTAPRACRITNVKLRTTSNTTVMVDQVSCMEILSVDRAFYIVEYIPYVNNLNCAIANNTNAAMCMSINNNNTAINNLAVAQLLTTSVPGFHRDLSNASAQLSVNLDNIDQDKELDFVLDLLMNS